MAFAIPFVWIADPDRQRRGIDLVMGLFEACERGGETVVLTDGAGRVTAGPGGLTRQHRSAAH